MPRPIQIKFHSSELNCLLEVDSRSVDLSALGERANNDGLNPKSEFHLTVLGTAHARKIKEIFGSDEELDRMAKEIERMIYEYDWEYQLLPEYYKISKIYRNNDTNNAGKVAEEKRESYIQLASLPDLESFYVRLNKTLNTDFEVPLPHITLYSKSTDPNKMLRGIGLYSKKELEQYGSRIS